YIHKPKIDRTQASTSPAPNGPETGKHRNCAQSVQMSSNDLGGPVSGEIVAPDREITVRELVDAGDMTASVILGGSQTPTKQSRQRPPQWKLSFSRLSLQVMQHSVLSGL
ncbi:MAG: hypothetical protein OEM91_13835, partial [Hyphomicrobiales bacterium]|nr:hypothetical protein [Hyphomicrobiales bacterium]